MRRILVVGASALSLLLQAAPPVGAQPPDEVPAGPPLERVIVVFHDTVADPAQAAEELATRFEGRLEHVYLHALRGFSAALPPQALTELAADPRVALVEPDHVVQVAVQTLPTGIDRIEADRNPNVGIDGVDDRVDVDIAIIDTGIDLSHPDLNVSTNRATDCTKSPCQNGSGSDGHGHGTHVAGSAAALDNGIGAVGVAPGARLWAVKVLDDSGSGFLSWVVAGIDWVTARADQIEVANMSLGCECPSASMDAAIANSVASGVVYTVAAGNNAKDASTFHPAAHPDVITVSAAADFDGQAGGAGAPTCRDDQDDTLADFSNFGSLVELAAPGVCIFSTWKGGTYHTISGTSMASPHVAGAAGLFVALNGRDRNGDGVIDKADADSVRAELIAAALPQSHACGYTNERASQGSNEPLLFVNGPAFGGDGSCTVAGDPADAPPSASWVEPQDGASVSGTVAINIEASDTEDPQGTLTVEWRVGEGAWQPAPYDEASGSYQSSWDTTGEADGSHVLEARATDSQGQTGTHSITVEVANAPPPSGDYSAEVLADDPIAYWRLGEASGTTASDASGNGHHATYRNSPTLGVPGLIAGDPDTAVGFDGANDYVEVPSSGDIDSGGPYSTRTVELWFRASDVTRRQVLYEEGGAARGLGVYLDAGQVYVIGWNAKKDDATTPWGPVWVSAPVSTGTTYHVVLVFDQPGGRLEGFLNGSSMGSASGVGMLHTHGAGVGIGAMNNDTRFHDGTAKGNGYYFAGTIDEVALYPSALSATRIAAHYAVGSGSSQ